VQNFADVEAFIPFRVPQRSALPGNHIFYIGTVHDMYYDFNRVVEAVYLLKQGGVEVTLHCVGYAKLYLNNDLPKVSCYEAVKDQIIFYGYMGMQQGYEISKQCKIGLCLKDQPAPILVSHERKFFEYIAAGLPMICCDSHIYSDSLKKYEVGKAVDLNTAQSLADGIRGILADPATLDRMQQNCYKAAAEEYNWESQEKILVELYWSLLV
jgi:glycosyltransferase involved in cell wall biosynthesis